MNGTPLIDWCEQVASPVLKAAAAGQPISFAAKQALLRLSQILASQARSEDESPAEKRPTFD
ncbi:hypothetical protein [Dyella sp. 2RAB6]|uniref:hypothetical protein n=1 Tax=Dyella sp. 2RAB6 TaxID=3232992 RepID=UPI003F910D0A